MKFEIKYKNQIYDCEWFDKTDFEKINPITQASGFVFNDKGEVCLIKVKKDVGWSLPGGGKEKQDESIKDTFIREVNEEADLDLKNIKRLGYIKIVTRENPRKIFYSVRFVALVDKVKGQTIDPPEGIIAERIFIDPKDFDKYAGWGENGIFQLNRALKNLKGG